MSYLKRLDSLANSQTRPGVLPVKPAKHSSAAFAATPPPQVSDFMGGQGDRLARLRVSFDVVMTAFRTPPDEIAVAWSIALADLDAAEATFHGTAALLKAGWNASLEQAAAFLRRTGIAL